MSNACSRAIARGCYKILRDFRGLRTFPMDFPRAMPGYVIPDEEGDNRLFIREGEIS